METKKEKKIVLFDDSKINAILGGLSASLNISNLLPKFSSQKIDIPANPLFEAQLKTIKEAQETKDLIKNLVELNSMLVKNSLESQKESQAAVKIAKNSLIVAVIATMATILAAILQVAQYFKWFK